MSFYIKEWPDNTATLMTESGRVVWTFASAEEAAEAAQDCDDVLDLPEIESEIKQITLKAIA